MSDMEKSYSFHSVIVSVNHVITVECFILFIIKAVPQDPFFCVLHIRNVNISSVTRVVGDGVVTLQ